MCKLRILIYLFEIINKNKLRFFFDNQALMTVVKNTKKKIIKCIEIHIMTTCEGETYQCARPYALSNAIPIPQSEEDAVNFGSLY